MTGSVNSMALLCRQRCETVMASYAQGQMDLDAFVGLQAQKVQHNTQIASLRDASDYEASVKAYARELLGEEDASRLEDT